MNSEKGRSRKRKKAYSKKFLLTLMAALLVGTTAVGSSLAFLVDRTDQLTNTFTPSEVKGEIVETFDKEVKKDVKIKNTGDIPAYVRVTVVPNWVDGVNDERNVAAEVKESDYAITWNDDASGWFKESDGFYYYSRPVLPGFSTDVLIKECKPLVSKTDASGNQLHFELHVIASLIQAEPSEAVEKAWGVNVDVNGNITK